MAASLVGWIAFFDHTWARAQEKCRRGLVLLEHGAGFVEIAPGVSRRPHHRYYVEVPLVDKASGLATHTFIDLDDSGDVHECDVEPVAQLPLPLWHAVLTKMAEYGEATDR